MQYNLLVTFEAGPLISAACAQSTQRHLSFVPKGFNVAPFASVRHTHTRYVPDSDVMYQSAVV